MKPKYFSLIGTAALLAAASPLLHPTTAQALTAEVQPKAEDVEILTRGPVHEAFAEAISSKPQPGYIISKAPPSLIEELPPEQQLEGDNVTWISGYWAWDEDTNDFLWISGVWRNIPPGRQWVPGYWNDLHDGRWQWVSGYWADTASTEVEYVGEAPPESLDAGPNTTAPDEDSSWVPGNWRYAETRYVWSPGYWNTPRPDWCWVPSRWCWAPSGYYYVDGYWDYAVANRGVLFAPVYYHRPLWADPGYCYTPSVVVSLGVFDSHCWYRPNYCHYYFGDYYGPRYSDLGFFVSYGWHGRRGCYDPIWAHNYWNHRFEPGWRNQVADRYAFFRDNADARPFRNWAAMRDFRSDRFSDDPRSRSRLFASTLNGFARNPVRGERFRQLSAESRNQFVAQRQQLRDFAQNRRQVENARLPQNNIAGNANNRSAVLREQLRRSPVSGRQVNQIAQNQAPPSRPRAAGSSARVRPDAVVRPNANAGRELPQGMQRGTGRANGAQVNRNPAAGRDNLNPLAGRNRVQPNIGRSTQRESQQATQPNAQRRPQVTPQQRQQQVRPQSNAVPRTRQQQAAPQRQSFQRPQVQRAAPQQRQQVRPQQQRVAPQRQQSIQRPQVQRAAPQQRQQVRPQQQRVAPQRQSFQRPQAQRSAPQRSVQRQSISRPSVQRAAPQRQSVSRPSVSRPSTQRSSSSTQRKSSSGRSRD